jgi:protein arginine N-methyltransferase 3
MDSKTLSDSGSTSSCSDLDLQEEDGWEDAEQDQEDIQVISLFDDKIFPDVVSMIAYCKEQHRFDLIATLKVLSMCLLSKVPVPEILTRLC